MGLGRNPLRRVDEDVEAAELTARSTSASAGSARARSLSFARREDPVFTRSRATIAEPSSQCRL
jgi:hypothetical protein